MKRLVLFMAALGLFRGFVGQARADIILVSNTTTTLAAALPCTNAKSNGLPQLDNGIATGHQWRRWLGTGFPITLARA